MSDQLREGDGERVAPSNEPTPEDGIHRQAGGLADVSRPPYT